MFWELVFGNIHDTNNSRFCNGEFQVFASLLYFVSICPWSVLGGASLLSLDSEGSVESSRDSPLAEHILLSWTYS